MQHPLISLSQKEHSALTVEELASHIMTLWFIGDQSLINKKMCSKPYYIILEEVS